MILDENYNIEKDSYNFILKYRKVEYSEEKQKDITSTNMWYCRSLSHALGVYLNECLRPCEDVVSLRRELERVEELVNKIKYSYE